MKLFKKYLDSNNIPYYSCLKCSTHLAYQNEIISKRLYLREGLAYLFNSLVNITKYENPRDLILLTGRYTVQDICCASCRTLIGWTYVHASEPSQYFKVGKHLLELKKIVKENKW